MKQLLLLLLLVPFLGSAQKQPPGNPLTFSDIIYADDTTLSKDELYSRILIWSGETFNSSESVIDVQDRESGTVILKAKFSTSYMAFTQESSTASYPVKISIKQGKVKIDVGAFIMDNINFKGYYITDATHCGYKGIGHKVLQRIFESYQKDANLTHMALLSSLKASINKKNDW